MKRQRVERGIYRQQNGSYGIYVMVAGKPCFKTVGPKLAEILIGRSYDTIRWVVDQGIVMEPAVSLSGIKVGNTIKWSPGAVIRARHEGVGLSRMWFEIAESRGVEIRYATSAVRGLGVPEAPRTAREALDAVPRSWQISIGSPTEIPEGPFFKTVQEP